MSDGLKSRSGNVALAFALLAPVLVAAAGVAIDANRFHAMKSALQAVADGAALGGARLYLLGGTSGSAGRTTPEAVARHTIEAGLAALGFADSSSVNVEASVQPARVNVSISAAFTPSMLSRLAFDHLAVNVQASAEARGSSAGVCIIGLETTARDAVMLNTNAKIVAPGCSIFSNSTSTTGLAVYRNAKIESALSCSGGGAAGGSLNYSPAPITDCPPREDPLKDRVKPAVGSCDYDRKQVNNFVGALDPGVYCGGLVINGASVVTFNPGIYVIKGGPMTVLRTSVIRGENVGFFFTGRNADLYFQEQSDISLSGPTSGAMAGLLIWQDNDPKYGKMFEVRSSRVHPLTGTIYLPNSTFYAAVDAPVAQSSAYTAVVARKIALDGNVELTLNDDYGSTDVPAPAGIASNGEVVIRK